MNSARAFWQRDEKGRRVMVYEPKQPVKSPGNPGSGGDF
jgi:hypothetical protein